jgi:hypothetical protein
MNTRFTRNPAVRWLLLALAAVALVAGCGISHGTSGTTDVPTAPAAVQTASAQLHTVLAQVHASPQAQYVLAQVQTCPSMGEIGSFFVQTTSANANTIDAQRFAIVRYMFHKSNREQFYTCLQAKANKLLPTPTQQTKFVACAKNHAESLTANAKTDAEVIMHPEKDGVPMLRSYLLTTLPGCYQSVGGVIPTSTTAPTPASTKG